MRSRGGDRWGLGLALPGRRQEGARSCALGGGDRRRLGLALPGGRQVGARSCAPGGRQEGVRSCAPGGRPVKNFVLKLYNDLSFFAIACALCLANLAGRVFLYGPLKFKASFVVKMVRYLLPSVLRFFSK